MASWSTSAIVFASAFGLTSCGKNAVNDVAITGGIRVSETSPKETQQSVVAIAANQDFFNKSRNPSSSFFVGVIIAPNFVLTAAHCSGLFDRQATLVVFAPTMVKALAQKGGLVRSITAFERHPLYPWEINEAGVGVSPYANGPEAWMKANPMKAPHDLVLVRFSGALPAGYVPAKMAELTDNIPGEAVLAGFGITSSGNILDTGELRYVDKIAVQPIDSEYTARKWIPVAETVGVDKIAAGESKPRGACPGDSGGPAFASLNGQLGVFGILSLGESTPLRNSSVVYCLGHEKGASAKVGNIYTDIRYYRSWINQAMQRLSQPN